MSEELLERDSAKLVTDGEGPSSGVEGLFKSKFPSNLEKLF